MNSRTLLGGLLAVVCLAEIWVIGGQRREMAGLQAAQPSAETQAPISTTASDSATASTMIAATPELLRLRSEVTRLEAQKRELASTRPENEKLHAQAAAHGTNTTRGVPLPAGYVRKSEARFAGYASPQDTLQSFLWALQNKNGEQLTQALTPEAAEQLKSQNQLENMMKQTDELIGMGITSLRTFQDGSVRAEVQMAPGIPSQPLVFKNINGEWKLDALR